MNTITVCDANIFSVLIETELLDAFFALPWEVHTTDMVVHEMKSREGKEKIAAYNAGKKLHVKEFTTGEMVNLSKFYASQRNSLGITVQECSVWLYAMDNDYVLLTGDKRLKETVQKKVKVYDIFDVIDNLVVEHLLIKNHADDIQRQLRMLNHGIPIV